MEYVSDSFNSTFRSVQDLQNIARKFAWHIHDHIVPHERNGYHPHILGNRAMGLFALLLCTVKVSVIVASALSVAPIALSSAITQEKIIELTNSSRLDYGLSALKNNSLLAQAAQEKANDMLANQYFAHTSPSGLSPWFWISKFGYTYITAGENLAVNFREAEDVEVAWMNSPGHKANILNKYFEEIGVGISQGMFEGHETTFVVQMFGTLADQAVSVTNTPTVLQTQPTPIPQEKTIPKTAVAKPVQEPIASTGFNSAPVAEPLALKNGPEELKILRTQADIDGSIVHVTVNTSTSAVGVTVSYGTQSVLLKPQEGNIWVADIPLKNIDSGSLQVKTSDITGNVLLEQVADFSKNVQDNYNPTGVVEGTSIRVFGVNLPVQGFERGFYLLFVATLLSCLIIAIAVHRHVQHVQMVANTSFVIVLAMLLWLG